MSEPNILHDILERSGFSPKTREAYSRTIDRWIEFAGEDPKGWTRVAAQKFYDKCLASGVKVITANVYVSNLRYVSKWYAVRMGDPNLDFAVVQTRADVHSQKTRHALLQPEVETLLRTCAAPPLTPLDHRDLVMMIIGLETGMRRKSLAGMDIEGLGTHQRHHYPIAVVPIKGPGGVVKYPVPLSDLCVATIAHWRKWLTKNKHMKGAVFPRLDKRIGPKGDIVWTPRDGLSLPMINKIMTGRASAAGLDHMHPHLLRHTFISWREATGLSSVQIASITGHRPSKDEKGQSWGAMGGYLDLELAGETARNSTPEWLAALVDKLLGGL